MSFSFRTNASVLATSAQRIQALETQFPADAEVVINTVSYKVSEIIVIYRAALDARAALIKSRARVRADLVTRRDAEAKRDAVDQGFKAWALVHLGADSTAATELGFSPRKRAAPSAETVANAVKLAGATRKARHTIGRKAKLKIKGSLLIPTDPAAGALPAPPAPSTAEANGAQASPPAGAPLNS